MKKSIYLFIFICFIGINNLKAQATAYPVATLEHNGTTSVYYGYYAFQTACNNANNFDTIYLSADNFSSNFWIYKTIHVYGAGSSDPITPATTFNDWFYKEMVVIPLHLKEYIYHILAFNQILLILNLTDADYIIFNFNQVLQMLPLRTILFII